MKRLLFGLVVFALCSTAFADKPRRHQNTPPRHSPHYQCEKPRPRVNYYYYNWNNHNYQYVRGCPNPRCRCNPCNCYPTCNCNERRVIEIEIPLSLQTDTQCPNGRCPRPESPKVESPKVEGNIEDNAFVTRAYQSSVRLPQPASNGGSSTVIDCYRNYDHEWIVVLLGCYHVVEERKTVDVEFFWPDKFTTTGYIVAVDKANDLSLLSARVPNQVPYVGLSRSSPNKGERVLTIGCPGLKRGKGQEEPSGYFTTVTSTTSRTRSGSPRFEVNYPAVGGHSGGGVFRFGSTAGVLVSRDPKESQVVPAEQCVSLYETVFCEGAKTPPSLKNEDGASQWQRLDAGERGTCIFDFFRRRQPRPPYSGPPSNGAPDLRPEPPPTPPVVVVPEPEPPQVEEETRSPVETGFAIGIPIAFGALVISFLRKVKTQAAV